MPIDPTISLQAKPPDLLQTLGQWISLGRAKQQLERETATLPTDIERSRAESALARLNEERARRTMEDYVRTQRAAADTAESGAKVAAGSVEADIQRRRAEGSAAESGAQRAQFELSADQMKVLRASADRFVNDPDVIAGNLDKMIEKLADARDEAIRIGVPRAMAEAQFAQRILMAQKDPKGLRQTMLNSIMAGNTSANQAELIQPRGPVLSSGQVTRQAQTNPFAQGAGQSVPGTATPQQLPPTTQTVVEVSPGAYQSVFVGAQSGAGGGMRAPGAPQAPTGTQTPPPSGLPAGGAPAQPQGLPRGMVPAGPPMGAAENMAGVVEVVNRDRLATQQAAQAASQNVPVLQTIRKYASSASTGVASDQRSVIAGLAGYLGMSEGDLVKTSTDLLAKNSAMLSLAGGNTDAARALAEAANPNTKMTPTAIRKAVNQLIAQQDLALAKQSYMQRFADDPVAYSRALTSFNAIADPRVFEFQNMTVKEKAEFKNSLSPAEVEAFGKKLQAARQFGFIK